jgi:hypothetical protein
MSDVQAADCHLSQHVARMHISEPDVNQVRPDANLPDARHAHSQKYGPLLRRL